MAGNTGHIGRGEKSWHFLRAGVVRALIGIVNQRIFLVMHLFVPFLTPLAEAISPLPKPANTLMILK